MLVSEIKTNIATTLEDEGNSHFTSQDLTDTVQDGYELISLLTQNIEAIDTITLTAEKNYYDLATLFSNYYRVWALYNNQTRRWMTPQALKTIQSYSARWESQHGEPREWCPLGARHIALYPKPTASGGTLTVYLKKFAATLSAGDTFDLPEALQDAIEEYGVGDLHVQDLEYTKAEKHIKFFNEKLKQIEHFVQHRSLPDRVYSLQSCLSSQTLISSE